MVIWLIGMPGSGKTTLGKMLYEHYKKSVPELVFLDGDILRDVWGDNLGHTMEARAVNAHRISHLCRLLDAQNINVIASVMSVFTEWQAWNRKNFSDYFEIYLKVFSDVLFKRDPKGIYREALTGKRKNVMGVDEQYPEPPNPDLILDISDQNETPEQTMLKITDVLNNKNIL